jgi:AraC-like DNA-binding protein
VDVLDGLLDGPRARGAFVLRSTLAPPWSMRIEDEAPLTLVAVLRGAAVVHRPGETARLTAGDVAVVLGPEPYTVADDPTTAPQVVIGPGQICRAPDGTEIAAMTAWGTRTWGNAPEGSTELLTGTYEHRSAISQRLLAVLPPLLVQRADAWDDPVAALLAQEVTRDALGQEAVLDRLLDLLLITTLRTWLAQADPRAPGWHRAQTDPVVRDALALLHDRPALPWTVASLARATGLSRAAFARRFTELVGEPPMTYLAHWRLALAADLLDEPGATLSAVAGQVGYGSAFALSAAFTRVRGISPREHRRRA